MQRQVESIHDIRYSLEDIFFDSEFGPDDSHIRKTYMDIGSNEEFWQWLNGPFVDAISGLNYYASPNSTQPNSIAMYNHMIGGIRIRQQRVRSDSCIPIHKDIGGDQCFSYFSILEESKKSFGTNNMYSFF